MRETTEENTIEKLALEQNYPNPGNPSTIIHYHLHPSEQVILKIINLLGQEIKTLVDTMKGGSYTVIGNGTNNQGNRVTSGISCICYKLRIKCLLRRCY